MLILCTMVLKTGPVLNAKNIKADSHKILRPTHFSWGPVTKIENIKTDATKILRLTLENKTEALKTDNRVMYTTYIWIMLKTAKC